MNIRIVGGYLRKRGCGSGDPRRRPGRRAGRLGRRPDAQLHAMQNALREDLATLAAWTGAPEGP